MKSLWSLVSRALWEEAEAPVAPVARAIHAATGAPAYLRGAVRFVVVGSSAMLLTAQVAGIRLAARVDADPSHCIVKSQQCKAACPGGSGFAACIQKCNDERKVCEGKAG
jgi:hypothetical protein